MPDNQPDNFDNRQEINDPSLSEEVPPLDQTTLPDETNKVDSDIELEVEKVELPIGKDLADLNPTTRQTLGKNYRYIDDFMAKLLMKLDVKFGGKLPLAVLKKGEISEFELTADILENNDDLTIVGILKFQNKPLSPQAGGRVIDIIKAHEAKSLRVSALQSLFLYLKNRMIYLGLREKNQKFSTLPLSRVLFATAPREKSASSEDMDSFIQPFRYLGSTRDNPLPIYPEFMTFAAEVASYFASQGEPHVGAQLMYSVFFGFHYLKDLDKAALYLYPDVITDSLIMVVDHLFHEEQLTLDHIEMLSCLRHIASPGRRFFDMRSVEKSYAKLGELYNSYGGERVRNIIAADLEKNLPEYLADNYKPITSEHGIQILDFAYSKSTENTIKSHVKGLFLKHLSDVYQPTVEQVSSISGSIAEAENPKDVYPHVHNLVAHYLYKEDDSEASKEIRSICLNELKNQALYSPFIEIQALAKFYIYNLHRRYESTHETHNSVNTVFNAIHTFEKEESAKATLLAVRELLAKDGTVAFLQHQLVELASNSAFPKIQLAAAHSLCAIYYKEHSQQIAVMLNSIRQLGLDEDLNKHIGYVLQAAPFEERYKLFHEKVFQNEAFQKAIKKLDKDCVVTSHVIEPDNTDRESSFSNTFVAPQAVEITFYLHDAMNAQNFGDLLEAFNKAQLEVIQDIGPVTLIDKELSDEEVLIQHAGNMPCRVTFKSSLHEEFIWGNDSRAFDALLKSQTVYEPGARPISAPDHLCMSGREEYNSIAQKILAEQKDFYNKELNNIFNVQNDRQLAEAFIARNGEPMGKLNKLREGVQLRSSQTKILGSLNPDNLKDVMNILSSHRSETMDLSDEPYVQEIDGLIRNVFLRADKLLNGLTMFESQDVALSEIKRTFELLMVVRQNAKKDDYYLKSAYRERPYDLLVTQLPRNEPFFSLVNEALLPAMLHKQAVVKVHECFKRKDTNGKDVFTQMCSAMGIDSYTKNKNNTVVGTNIRFVAKDFSEDVYNTDDFKAKADTFIYAGPRSAALQYVLRTKRETKRLIIGGGSGNNPVIVTESANLELAAKEIAHAVTRNCGQDCTSPCSILVEGDERREEMFLMMLAQEIENLSIGDYNDWLLSPPVLGPLSSAHRGNIEEIENFLKENKSYIYHGPKNNLPSGMKDERTAYPTIVRKPLADGVRYEKLFAPIFMVQRFSDASELNTKFFTEDYIEHAMNVSIFTENPDPENVIYKLVSSLEIKHDGLSCTFSDDDDAIKLHPLDSILFNETLTSKDIDRGDATFGGRGFSATYQFIDNKFIAEPFFLLDAIYLRDRDLALSFPTEIS